MRPGCEGQDQRQALRFVRATEPIRLAGRSSRALLSPVMDHTPDKRRSAAGPGPRDEVLKQCRRLSLSPHLRSRPCSGHTLLLASLLGLCFPPPLRGRPAVPVPTRVPLCLCPHARAQPRDRLANMLCLVRGLFSPSGCPWSPSTPRTVSSSVVSFSPQSPVFPIHPVALKSPWGI